MIQQGSFFQAVRVLRQATGIVRSSIQTELRAPQQQQQQQQQQQREGNDDGSTTADVLQHIVLLQDTGITARSVQAQDENALFEVFQCAFCVPVAAAVVADDDCYGNANGADEWMDYIIYQGRTSAVLLYNLALAYHLQGLCTGVSSRELQLALQLYKMTLSVVESCCHFQAVDDHDDLLLLLVMAVFNNMGHIYGTFFYGPGSIKCIRALSALNEHNFVTRSQSYTEEETLLMNSVKHFFKLSCVMHHQLFCSPGVSLFRFAPTA